MTLDFEVILLVELEGLLVVALHVQHHFRHAPLHHAVLDGLLQELRGDTVATVWLQHRDSHDVALFGAVFKDVFLAGDGADEHILNIGELTVANQRLELVVEVLRVDHGECQVVQDAELLEILACEVAKFHIDSGLASLRLLLDGVLENTLLGQG